MDKEENKSPETIARIKAMLAKYPEWADKIFPYDGEPDENDVSDHVFLQNTGENARYITEDPEEAGRDLTEEERNDLIKFADDMNEYAKPLEDEYYKNNKMAREAMEELERMRAENELKKISKNIDAKNAWTDYKRVPKKKENEWE